jgi:sterol desaturase/sphingolipid hydroxylase (fatty acid hydroxylase superfamily)
MSDVVAVASRQNAAVTLPGAAGVFFRQPSPLIISSVLLAATGGRVYVGGWSWLDLIPPGVILALQPFTEWLIHVFILHFKPQTVRGFRVDPLVSRKHRAHHADPRDLELQFIPLPALAGLLGGLSLLLVFLPLGRALSGLIGGYAMTLLYEWTHYLIHSPYRPRHRIYRYVWRAHRNHHFRNERYWFGVTVHLADHVLGTFPDRSDVELSPTARTLGVEPA